MVAVWKAMPAVKSWLETHYGRSSLVSPCVRATEARQSRSRVRPTTFFLLRKTMINYNKIFYEMDKQELGEYLNETQRKIDYGNHKGRDIQLLKIALEIYIKRFE